MTLTRKSPALFASDAGLRLMLLACVVIYGMMQVRFAVPLFSSFQMIDNDDLMRMQSVRDFLGGQGWFDMHQYRVLAPGGLSMHWSRLVDLPLIALYHFFALGFDPEFSLKMAAAVWPVLLFLAYLAVILRTMLLLFGRAAAAFAIMAATIIPPTTSLFFAVGRVDHHNLQILLMTVMTAFLIRSQRGVSEGIWCGSAAGLSLAVGLETIPFITVVSLMHLSGSAFGSSATIRKTLAYGTSMCFASVVFFLSQTAPQHWFTPMCDQFSLPWIWLCASFFFVALAGQALRNLGATRPLRLLAIVAISLFLATTLWPMLAPCREGPFSDMDPELRQIIVSTITESLPWLTHFQRDWGIAIRLISPHVMLFIILLSMLLSGFLISSHRKAAAALLILMSLGIGMAFYQLRGLLPVLAISPFVFGVIADRLLNYRVRLPSFVTTILLGWILVPSLPVLASNWMSRTAKIDVIASQPQAPQSVTGLGCFYPDSIRALSNLPEGRILSDMNLGPGIVFYTNHSVLSAPYHRHPASYEIGRFHHEQDIEKVKQYAENADYIVLCSTSQFTGPSSFGQKLVIGDVPEWAIPIDAGVHPFLVFRLQ